MQNNSVNQDFYFCNTEVRDILKETTALNNKLLKEVSKICAQTLNDIWNKEIITQKVFLIIFN